MALKPNAFAISEVNARMIAEWAERDGTAEHQRAVAYLTGKGEPNIFTKTRQKAQFPETCIHLAKGEQTWCGHTIDRGVQYVEHVNSISLVDCVLCADAIKAALHPK